MKNLKKSYGENGSYMQVLKGISTGVEKGEMCVIQGTSGSGKSTFTTKLLENGFRLMTDDVAIVDISSEGDIMVYPAFPQQKEEEKENYTR